MKLTFALIALVAAVTAIPVAAPEPDAVSVRPYGFKREADADARGRRDAVPDARVRRDALPDARGRKRDASAEADARGRKRDAEADARIRRY